jgi:Protein of unknown function (DUF998)
MNSSTTSAPIQKNGVPTRTRRNKHVNRVLQKLLPICGILSSLLYVAMNIFVPVFYSGYSSASQTVSELSAIDAPTRTLWIALGTVYTLLVLAFGWGMLRSPLKNRPLHLAGRLIFVYGVVSLIWPFAPMHQRPVLAAGGKTITDTIHIVLAMVTVVLMTIAMAIGATAFGKRFRSYSIVTILLLLVFGTLTGFNAPGVSANLPTPMAGVWERINIGVFLLWISVLAVLELQKEKNITDVASDTPKSKV